MSGTKAAHRKALPIGIAAVDLPVGKKALLIERRLSWYVWVSKLRWCCRTGKKALPIGIAAEEIFR